MSVLEECAAREELRGLGCPGTVAIISHIHSFPPISDQRARVLILGSMPGKVSLRESQYYAHPRNLFWRFMQEILGISRELPYCERCNLLKGNGLALWDTLKTCTRSSSLDSDIDDSTVVANDFASFLSQHPKIELICFNGAKSESVFMKRVAPSLAPSLSAIELRRLPSTSPANASIALEVKLEQWRSIVRRESRKTSR